MAAKRSNTGARGASKAAKDAPRRAYQRIVAKFGTSLLTAGTDRLDLEAMAGLVGQVARLRRGGAEVIIVTSGAIAAGRRFGDVPDTRVAPLSALAFSTDSPHDKCGCLSVSHVCV